MKSKNYELRSVIFIILNLDLLIFFNSTIPFYYFDMVRIFIYTFYLIIFSILVRHLFLFIKINNENKYLKGKFNLFFLISTISLLFIIVAVNTIISFLNEGGFNIIIFLVNIILTVLHNVLFIYYYKNNVNKNEVEKYSFSILRNSFINKNDEENRQKSFQINFVYYSSIFVSLSLISYSYFYITLKTDSFDIGYIFTHFTGFSIIFILSLIFFITITIILVIFSYKNKFFKLSKIIAAPILEIIKIFIICLVALYIKKYLFPDFIDGQTPKDIETSVIFISFLLLITYLLWLFLLGQFNYFDDTYIRYLRKLNKNNNTK